MRYENTILHGPAEEQLKTIDSDSIDLIVTDPPYGYSFMNKDWDKAVVGVDTWKECLRVLKPGAFAFIMSSPRQDVLCKMILNLIDAGFETNFTSLYWTYASGFPKAADVSKLVDKRNGRNFDTSLKDYLNSKRLEKGLSFNQINNYLGTALTGGGTASAYMGDKEFNEIPTQENYNKLKTLLDLDDRYDELIEREEAKREIIGKDKQKGNIGYSHEDYHFEPTERLFTKPATAQAKKLEGAYAGFQPKPALEVILTVMKPLSQKTFVDQALANQKGITWLDDCRIPYQSEADIEQLKRDTARVEGISMLPPEKGWNQNNMVRKEYEMKDKGRFPANLLVSDDVLNNGINYKNSTGGNSKAIVNKDNMFAVRKGFGMNTKADGIKVGYGDSGSFSRYFSLDSWSEKTLPFLICPKPSKAEKGPNNNHPTVKSRKLMSYLITMGSRQGDIVLDPFCGSGTVLIAARQLARDFIGCEINEEYVKIAMERLKPYLLQSRLSV